MHARDMIPGSFREDRPIRLIARTRARLSSAALVGLCAALTACAYRGELPPPIPAERPVDLAALDAYNRGLEAYRDGRYRDATDMLASAIALDDGMIAAHRVYQEAWNARARRATAMRIYRDRLDTERNAVNVYLYGRLQQDLDVRRGLLDEAIRLDPHFAWSFLERALILERQGARDGAAADFARAAALAPNDPLVHVHRGGFELRRGQPHRALDAFYHALRLDQANHHAVFGLFRTHARYRAFANAMGRLREALLLQPGRVRYHRAFRNFADRHASLETLAEIDRFLEKQLVTRPDHPEIVHTLGWIRLRIGRPYDALRLLERAASLGADPVEILRDTIEADVRVARYRSAFERFRRFAPNAILFDENNAIRDRWFDLLRATEAVDRSATASNLQGLARAYAAVGWVEEALQVYDRIRLSSPDRPGVAEEIESCRDFLRLVDVLGDYFEKRYKAFVKNRQGRGLAEVLRDVARHARLIADVPDPGAPPVNSFAFLGTVLDGSAAESHPLVRYFDRFNHYLMVGQRAGGPSEAIVCERLAFERRANRPRFGRTVAHRYVLGHHVKVRSFRESLDQNLGGVTVGLEFFVNMDFVQRWRRAVLGTWRRFSDPDDKADLFHDEALRAADREAAIALDTPLDVKRRLFFRFCESAGPEAHDVERYVEMVRTHEEGHILDAARYLPVTWNLWRGLGLFFENGLSAGAVEGHLEGNAELTALAEGPSPLLSLSQIVGFLPARDAAPPHSLGYFDVARRICAEIYDNPKRYPAIDRSRVILQQLDRLTPDELRALGRQLATERNMAAH